MHTESWSPVDIRHRSINIFLLVERIYHFADDLGLDGHAAILVGLGHLAPNHEPTVAIAPVR